MLRRYLPELIPTEGLRSLYPCIYNDLDVPGAASARRGIRWTTTRSVTIGSNPATQDLQPQAVHDPTCDCGLSLACHPGLANGLRSDISSPRQQPGNRRFLRPLGVDLPPLRCADIRAGAQPA